MKQFSFKWSQILTVYVEQLKIPCLILKNLFCPCDCISIPKREKRKIFNIEFWVLSRHAIEIGDSFFFFFFFFFENEIKFLYYAMIPLFWNTLYLVRLF